MSKNESSHPTGHNCADDLVYSDRKGKCINPKLEDESKEYLENPNSRSKASSNLTFPTAKQPNAHIVRKEIKPDTHIDVVDFQADAKAHQNKQRQPNTKAPQAVDSGSVPGIKHKQFKNRNFGDHGI